jgi:hypothetical protein
MSAARVLTAIAAAGLFAGQPAIACSPSLESFENLIPQTYLAIQARARFDYSEHSQERVAGRVFLDRIYCFRKPRELARCPSALEIGFDEGLDGYNCPPDVASDYPDRLRYFRLSRNDRGAWQIDTAYLNFSRRLPPVRDRRR